MVCCCLVEDVVGIVDVVFIVVTVALVISIALVVDIVMMIFLQPFYCCSSCCCCFEGVGVVEGDVVAFVGVIIVVATFS